MDYESEQYSSIIDRIANDDCTIEESDFYPPEDKRYLKSDDKSSEQYKFYEEFNELGEIEEFFD